MGVRRFVEPHALLLAPDVVCNHDCAINNRMEVGFIIPSDGLQSDPQTSIAAHQDVSSLEHSIKIKRYILNVAVALNTAHQLSIHVLNQTADDVYTHTSKSQGLVAAIYSRYLELSDSMASQVKMMRANGTLIGGSDFAGGSNGGASISAHQLIILPEHFSRNQFRQKFSKCIKCRGTASDDRIKAATHRLKRGPEHRCECRDVVDNGDKTITLPSSPWEGSLYKLTLLVSLRAKILLKSIFAAFVQNVSMANFRRQAVVACCKMRLELLMKRCFQSILFEALSTKYIAMSAYQRAYTIIKRKFLKPAYLKMKAHCTALQLFTANYDISVRHWVTSQMRSGFSSFLGNKNNNKYLARRRSSASLIAMKMTKRCAFLTWTAALDEKKSVKVMLSERFSSLTPTAKHAEKSGFCKTEGESVVEDTHAPASRRVSFAADLSETSSSSSSSSSRSNRNSTHTTESRGDRQPKTALKSKSKSDRALPSSEFRKEFSQSVHCSREELINEDPVECAAECDTASRWLGEDQCPTQRQGDNLSFTQATQTVTVRKASCSSSTVEDFIAASRTESPDKYFESIFKSAGTTRVSDLCRSNEGSEQDSEGRESSPEPLPAPLPIPASAAAVVAEVTVSVASTVVEALPAVSISTVRHPPTYHIAKQQRGRLSPTLDDEPYGGIESDLIQSGSKNEILNQSRSVSQVDTVRRILPSNEYVDQEHTQVESSPILVPSASIDSVGTATRRTGNAVTTAAPAEADTTEAGGAASSAASSSASSSTASSATAGSSSTALAAPSPPDVADIRHSRELDVYRGLLLSYERVFDELRLGTGYRHNVSSSSSQPCGPTETQLLIPAEMSSDMTITIRDSWRDSGPLNPRGLSASTDNADLCPKEVVDVLLSLPDTDSSTRSYDSDSIEESSVLRARERVRVSRPTLPPPTRQYGDISHDEDEYESIPHTPGDGAYRIEAVHGGEPVELSISLDEARQVRTVTLVQTQNQRSIDSGSQHSYYSDSLSDRPSPSWPLRLGLKATDTLRSASPVSSTIHQIYSDFSRRESDRRDMVYDEPSNRIVLRDNTVPFGLVETGGPEDATSVTVEVEGNRKVSASNESKAAVTSVSTVSAARAELGAHEGAAGVEECGSEATSAPDEEQVRVQCEIFDVFGGDAVEAPSAKLQRQVRSSVSVMQKDKSARKRRKLRRQDPPTHLTDRAEMLNASNNDTPSDSSAESTDEGDSVSSSVVLLPLPLGTDISSRSLSVGAQPNPAGLLSIESVALDATMATADHQCDTLDNRSQYSEERSHQSLSLVSDADERVSDAAADSTRAPSKSMKQRKVEMESSSRFLQMFSVTDITVLNKEEDTTATETHSSGLAQLSLALNASRPRPSVSSGTQNRAVTEHVIEYEDDTVAIESAILLRRCLRCFRKLRSLARISWAYRRVRRSNR